MSATAKLFAHGRGRAVRASKAGDRGILTPLATSAMSWALINETGDSPFMPEGREQLVIPADRMVSVS